MNKKQRLIILSDLWGKEKSDWIVYYTSILEKYFTFIYYDCSVLGELNKSNYTESSLHQQFISGGIDTAVKNLLLNEKNCDVILGFSIGGYIAWKACLEGLNAKNIFAVSATRLRYETQKPTCAISLIYGENDIHKPNNNWFKTLALKQHFVINEEHEFYRKKNNTKNICATLIKETV